MNDPRSEAIAIQRQLNELYEQRNDLIAQAMSRRRMSASVFARELGMSAQQVYAIAAKKGVRRRPAPTMREVAELAGVTPVTVSRTLKGSYKVSSTTRDRVLRAVEEIGYEQP